MSRFRLSFVLALAFPVALFAIDPKSATPPEAKKVMHKDVLHGDTRLDDYFWMKEKTNPEVIKHLEAENAYTTTITKSLEPLK
jgi:oligopeptidase B